MALVTLRRVHKSYRMDAVDVPALTEVDLDLQADRFTVISGPSGSGKSTLLNVIGCIDPPDLGQVRIGGVAVYGLADDDLADFRLGQLGFVFQNFNLLPVLTAHENVEYPLVLARAPKAKRRQAVLDMLDAVGLSGKGHHLPGQLSGGQRQRVAIARALVAAPSLVLADEPTANLDSATGDAIIALMRRMQRERRVSFVVSSHDPRVLAEADEAIHLRDGRIVDGPPDDDGSAGQALDPPRRLPAGSDA